MEVAMLSLKDRRTFGGDGGSRGGSNRGSQSGYGGKDEGDRARDASDAHTSSRDSDGAATSEAKAPTRQVTSKTSATTETSTQPETKTGFEGSPEIGGWSFNPAGGRYGWQSTPGKAGEAETYSVQTGRVPSQFNISWGTDPKQNLELEKAINAALSSKTMQDALQYQAGRVINVRIGKLGPDTLANFDGMNTITMDMDKLKNINYGPFGFGLSDPLSAISFSNTPEGVFAHEVVHAVRLDGVVNRVAGPIFDELVTKDNITLPATHNLGSVFDAVYSIHRTIELELNPLHPDNRPNPNAPDPNDPHLKPVLLDLGSGISLTENSGAAYSWGAGGNRYATGWASATTGILAYDANNDGTISGRGELALADYVKGAETDLEGLKHFDSNQDGSFDTKDAAWTSFKVWVDANQNGVSDAGELRSLDAADVAAIELKEQRHDKTLGVNVHQGTGRYTTKDGTTRTAVSVALGVDWAKVIEGATGIDLTSGRVPKTTALNTASWKITLNDPGPMTPAMALAAFAAAGSAAAGQPATLVYEGSTFTRDGKGAINVSASVLANHGVFGAKHETSTHSVTAGDIVSDAIDPARIAASHSLLPGVTLDVQNALDRVAASTAGR
jgi:hypothetical protein